MKVLFVSSWNKSGEISSIVKAQGESIKKEGIEIAYYGIQGKGLKGYLKNIKPLRRYLKKNDYYIVHAHYSLSGFICALSRAKKIIVSLMGSDVKTSKKHNLIIQIFNYFFWNKCIVKSEDMKLSSRLKKAFIIPNGVDLIKYTNIDKDKAIEKTGWDKNKKHILFAADPKRTEKNFELAKKAFDLITNNNIELHCLDNVNNEDVPNYFSSANIVLLTSFWEGSPNVIKEAMASNCPIVSTDVGDVRWLFGGQAGHYISNFNPEDVAMKIKLALDFSNREGKTKGRDRLLSLGLDSKTIANKIINLYKSL